MNKHLAKVSALALALLTLSFAQAAFAHEHDTYQIGGQQYIFVVGSLNEPVVVDDKTGVDLTVTTGGMPTMGPDGDMDGPPTKSVPITGLEKTLKVEISAGSQKKTFDLAPSYGKPGSYYATFYPTLQTTFAYRFFGTVSSTPVDITFTCNPAPSTVQADDKTVVKLSDQVSRVDKGGAFGCPLAKADLGFPLASVSNADLSAKVNSLSNAPADSSTKSLAIVALALSIVALAIANFRKPRT